MQDRIDEGDSKSVRHRKISPADKLPPTLTLWRWILLWFARIVMGICACWFIYLCAQIFWTPSSISECTYCTYLALVGFLSGLVTEFVIRHKIRVHNKRKEDRSEIEALIQEAKNVQPRLNDPERPIDYINKREKIDDEVRRLIDDLGPEGWTEFQVLTLDRMLIDFLPLEDLKARAQSSLDDLKEFAQGDAFSYDASLYYSWDEKISSAIDGLEKSEGKSEGEIDDQAESLRANLRSLLYHVADYEANWAEGSSIVTALRICGSVAVVVFTLMGILPILCPVQSSTLLCDPRLGILNWGWLGVAGAVASALIGLWNSNEVEVANTSGKRELWRMVPGIPLGLLAGILVFSALAGGLIEGKAVPSFTDSRSSSIFLSIVWAVVAGMGFERVFQRIRGAVES